MVLLTVTPVGTPIRVFGSGIEMSCREKEVASGPGDPALLVMLGLSGHFHWAATYYLFLLVLRALAGLVMWRISNTLNTLLKGFIL